MKFYEEEVKACSKLRNLEARKQKIEKQKAELERREALLTAALAGKNRRRDTARKILLGSYLTKMMNGNSSLSARIIKGLDIFLKKERDRSQFPELRTVNVEIAEDLSCFKKL